MKILFILHLPPPVHGSSMVGQTIKDSILINAEFECRYINLSTSRTIDEIGKNPLSKLGRYFSILGQVVYQVVVFRPQLCYISISVGDNGFYKDVAITLFARLTGAKIVYHLHNKGVATRQNNAVNNILYRVVFRKAKLILLSEYLYQDLRKYVSKKDVYYCANGIGEQLSVSSDQLAVSSDQLSVNSYQSTVSSKHTTISSPVKRDVEILHQQ